MALWFVFEAGKLSENQSYKFDFIWFWSRYGNHCWCSSKPRLRAVQCLNVPCNVHESSSWRRIQSRLAHMGNIGGKLNAKNNQLLRNLRFPPQWAFGTFHARPSFWCPCPQPKTVQDLPPFLYLLYSYKVLRALPVGRSPRCLRMESWVDDTFFQGHLFHPVS